MEKPGLPGFFISVISLPVLFQRIFVLSPVCVEFIMLLLDQWAERHILDAQRKGEFDSLPGEGATLVLDDDSCIPAELRAAWRLLKNAGCLPPELQQRKDAIELNELLRSINQGHPDYQVVRNKLTLLELKLQQAGVNTDFLHGDYADRLLQKIEKE